MTDTTIGSGFMMQQSVPPADPSTQGVKQHGSVYPANATPDPEHHTFHKDQEEKKELKKQQHEAKHAHDHDHGHGHDDGAHVKYMTDHGNSSLFDKAKHLVTGHKD